MAGTYYATTTEQTKTTVFGVDVQNTDPLVNLTPKPDGKIIDVVNDFAWSASPKLQSSSKVPVMYLQEREQVQNSLLSSAIYYLNAAAQFDIGDRDGNTAVGFNTAVKSFLTKLDDIVSPRAGQSNTAVEFFKNFQAGVEEIVKQNLISDASLLQDRLRSYIGIYLTKPTGFNYAFPFYNQTPLGINSSWSSESQLLTNPIAGAINVAQGAMERTAYMLNITQPGTFIEKPKFFQYETAGDTVTVSFPLFNTIKKTDKIPYQQNYELLWILAFQNKPYRTSFSRISPPKLYTLTVPGQKYMPYCYISDMKIDFGGTRRNLPVSIPSPNSMFGDVGPSRSDFNTVEISVPDAYMVSITFTSLLADVANRMIDNGFTSKKISVGTVPNTAPPTPAPSPTAPTSPALAPVTAPGAVPTVTGPPPTPSQANNPGIPPIDRFATIRSVSNKSIVKDYKDMVNDVLGSDAVANASGPRSELNLALTSTDRLPTIPANIRPTSPAVNNLGFLRQLEPAPRVTEPGPNFGERAANNLTSTLQRQRQSDLETFGPAATTDLNDLVSKIRPNPNRD